MRRTLSKVLGIAALLTTGSLAALTTSNFHLNGSIPTHTNLAIQGLDGSDAKQLFASVTDAQFQAGEILVSDAIQFRNIVSNDAVFVRIANKGWTLPAEYDAANGTKKADGSDNHFLIQVNSGTLTASAGAIGIEGSFGGQYVAVSNTPQQFLKLGEVTAGSKRRGMANGSADIDAKIVLDTVYDVPGTYSVELELTVTAQP